MTLQTVWHNNGTVKCVDSADSPAVIYGAQKATADTDVVGEITLRHTVTVKDGVVTSAEYQAPPPPTSEEWYERIQSRADTELQRGISVTISGETYGIRAGPAALALEVGGTVAAERARAAGETLTEPVPTDRGVVDFDADGLDAIFEAVRAHRRAVVERVRELQGMVREGTINEDELDTWP